MMQSCASAAKLRSGGPILPIGMKAKANVGIPPPRTVIGARYKRTDRAETVGIPSASSVHCTGRKTTPSGIAPCRTSRHRAIKSLRAKATIMGLRVPRASRSKPLRQGAVFLEHEKSPGQLDHASAHPSVAGSGQPFLPTFFSALVGRASEPGITRDGPSVAQVARQRFLHQHVRGLDADPDHARQQAHHGVWSVTGRSLQTLQAHLLNLPDLFTGQTTARSIRDAGSN